MFFQKVIKLPQIIWMMNKKNDCIYSLIVHFHIVTLFNLHFVLKVAKIPLFLFQLTSKGFHSSTPPFWKVNSSGKTSTSFRGSRKLQSMNSLNSCSRGFYTYHLSFYKMVLPLNCDSFFNNWHFFGEIFNPFFNISFNKSSSLLL